MPLGQTNVTQRCAIERQFVGHKRLRRVTLPLQQVTHEFLRGFLVSPRLNQNIQHLCIAAHGTPKIHPLTDTQLVVLTAAANREERAVLPLPKSLKIKGAAITKTLDSLRKKGLLEEKAATPDFEARLETEDGQRMMLVIKAETDIPEYRWDVSDFEACRQGVARVIKGLGPIEILINNAGITHDGTLHKITRDNWQAVLDTNLGSCFNMCRAVIEGMRASGFGRIVNVGSINGQAG